MVYRTRRPTCPVCRVPLLSTGSEELALDRCDGCGGTWVSETTLDALINRIDPTTPRPRICQQVPQVGAPIKACPACGKHMINCIFGPVNIDECSHGLWFDGEELEQALATAALEPARTPPTWYVRDGITSAAKSTGRFVLELALDALASLL